MPLKLWIDDDALKEGIDTFRVPPDDSWTVATTSTQAIELVQKHGFPTHIEFDHDLGMKEDGTKDTAMEFLKWFSNTHPEAIDSLEHYSIHSLNYRGKLDIQSYMDSWKYSRDLI